MRRFPTIFKRQAVAERRYRQRSRPASGHPCSNVGIAVQSKKIMSAPSEIEFISYLYFSLKPDVATASHLPILVDPAYLSRSGGSGGKNHTFLESHFSLEGYGFCFHYTPLSFGKEAEPSDCVVLVSPVALPCGSITRRGILIAAKNAEVI
jgi:hypothetical protein